MKRFVAVILATSCLASPALAIEVTNLDKVEHRVIYEYSGTREIFTVAPSQTERLVGVSNGIISLLDNKTGKKKISNERLHSDGILSGIVGAMRTSNIPADSDDTFVIWEDGTFAKQQSRRNSRFGGS